MFKISRRDLLKTMSGTLAVATTAGCGSGTNYESMYEVVAPSQDIPLDKDVTIKFSSGSYNCGSRCGHKLHVKNGRVVKLTSEGDIPRAGVNGVSADELDEYDDLTFDRPAQRRGCLRCYSYIKQMYQPDRLKYPLIQTGTKGDISGFVRASWDYAIDYVATKIAAAVKRRTTLGYVPLITDFFTYPSLAYSQLKDPQFKYLNMHSNDSTGGTASAKFEAVGITSINNSRLDKFNSDFVLIWAQDSSRTTFWQTNNHWTLTKLKEAGIDTVSLTSTFTDVASVLATGTTIDMGEYLGNGAEAARETVPIPKWLPCRPTTDGALAAAMCYVIYKRNLHDVDFLRNKCFGFFAGDSVISRSTGNASGTMIDGKQFAFPGSYTERGGEGRTFSKGDPFFGAYVDVPAGKSFEEYILSLENLTTDANAGWVSSGWVSTGGSAADDDRSKYYEVLGYASRLTGVPVRLIEALAVKYARPKGDAGGVSYIEQGGGPNRAFNGPEWVWMVICLSAVAGHSDKKGGGYGVSYMGQLEDSICGPVESLGSAIQMNPYGKNSIFIPRTGYHNIILRGEDQRSRKRMIEDIKFQTSGKDGASSELLNLESVASDAPLLEADVMMYSTKNIFLTVANINKSILAAKKAFMVVHDIFMTPSAQYADVIFPDDSNFEKESFTNFYEGPVLYQRSKAIERMYDTKDKNIINYLLCKAVEEKLRLGVDVGNPPIDNPDAATQEIITKATYAVMSQPSAPVYKAKVNPDYVAPTYEEFMKNNGKLSMIVPQDRSVIGLNDFRANINTGLENSTGRINFYAPFWELKAGEYYNPVSGKYESGYPDNITPDLYGPVITSSAPAKPVYRSGWRTPTARYIPVPEGFERFFSDPDLKNFTGYKSPISGKTYTLMYMTNKARNRAHTVFDNVAVIKDKFKQCVKMNKTDAAARGINDGDMVYVHNDRGCMKIPALISHSVIPGTVSVEHGAWYRKHPTETASVWLDINKTGVHEKIEMPVDIGGAGNMLTDDNFTLEPLFVDQALAIHGGPCEVSVNKPD